jgi:glycosyltransferase involved in cell wall biosynthesis
MAGRVSGPAKWRLLAGAQVCVVPSRYETFGLTALEALACGTPVVGFAIECLRQTVPATCGQLVVPFDVGALRASLEELLMSPLRCDEMGAAGRRHASSYSWDRLASEHEDLYERVISRSDRM